MDVYEDMGYGIWDMGYIGVWVWHLGDLRDTRAVIELVRFSFFCRL